MGRSLHDYSRTPYYKRPFGPGNSLRTTLLHNPASMATNGSWAVSCLRSYHHLAVGSLRGLASTLVNGPGHLGVLILK
jgi:hypothetical protein